MSLHDKMASYCRDDEYSTITLLKVTLQIAYFEIGTTAVASTKVFQPPMLERILRILARVGK